MLPISLIVFSFTSVHSAWKNSSPDDTFFTLHFHATRQDFSENEVLCSREPAAPDSHWEKQGYSHVYTLRAEKGTKQADHNKIKYKLFDTSDDDESDDEDEFFTNLGPVTLQQGTPMKKRRLD